MFPEIMSLLVAYSICFGIQHKLPFLHGRSKFTDEMLACTYCTGFHTGWITWVLTWGAVKELPAQGIMLNSLSVFYWAFASAIFCYAMDALIKWAEMNSAEIEIEED